MHAAAVLFGALLASQAPQPPAPPASADPATVVSLDRIRTALDRPAPLRLPAEGPKPDFVVHIVEKSWFERVMPPVDFRSGPVPPGGLYAYEQQQRLDPTAPIPLFNISLMPLVRGIARGFSSAYQAQSAAGAHRDVVRAIAEYCAAQPNGGTAIAICMDPTSIR
ncbi:MAG TPA: hypothetical protein VGJ29_21305 [Vicinamibacterales bacterium]